MSRRFDSPGQEHNVPLSSGSSEDIPQRREELLGALFEIFDSDKNGSLDVRELATLLRAVGVEISNERLMDCVNGDSANSGPISLSLDEFKKLIETIARQGLAPEKQLLLSAAQVQAANKKKMKPLDALRDDLQTVLESRRDVWFEELLADRGGQRQKLKEKDIFPKTCSVLVDVAEEVLFFEELKGDLMRDLSRCRESLKQTHEVGCADLDAVMTSFDQARNERHKLEADLQRMQTAAAEAAHSVETLRAESAAARDKAEAQHAALSAQVQAASEQIAVDNESAQKLVDEMKNKDQRIQALQAYGPKCQMELDLLQNEQQVNVMSKSLLLDTLEYYETEIPNKHDALISLIEQQKTVGKVVQDLRAARDSFDAGAHKLRRRRSD